MALVVGLVFALVILVLVLSSFGGRATSKARLCFIDYVAG